MTTIRLSIEGEGAAEAAASLLSEVSEIPELSEIAGTWKPLGDAENERGADFGVIADISSITALGLTFAQLIFNWYKKWKIESMPENKTLKKRIEKVILITGERRLMMKDASEEDIRKFSEKC